MCARFPWRQITTFEEGLLLKKMRGLILCLLLLLFFGTGCLPATREHGQRPLAESGLLELANWDFIRDGPVGLDGEWEFYWDRLLEPTDFAGAIDVDPETRMMNLPRSWNGYQVDGNLLAGSGYATFHLQIHYPHHNAPLALKIPIMCTAYKLWANGKLVAENGRVGRHRREMVPQYRPQVVSLDHDTDELDLVIQVSNYHHHRGGIWESIRLGTEAQLRRQRDQRLVFQLFLVGGFLALGLHYLGLFVVRRQEPYALYFFLASWLMVLRLFLVGEIFLIQLIPSFNWEWELKLEYFTYYLSMLVLLLLLESLFPAEVSPLLRQFTSILSISYSVITLLMPAIIYTRLLAGYQLFTLFLVAYFISVLALASKRRREGAQLMLAGGIVYCASIIYDVVFANYRILTIGHLAPLGFFIFLLAQHLALMKRLAAAFFRLEDLSDRLLALDKLKDEFLAAASLELKSPLATMQGIAESMLDTSHAPLTDNQKDNIASIATSSKRLSIYVDDILDFSRLKRQDLSLQLSAVSLSQEVDLVLEVCRPLTTGKDLELINLIPKNAPLVQADENRLLQILYNLIDNAIKFTSAGAITISADQNNGWLEVVVADTGIGIPLHHRETIFLPFQQADNSIPYRSGGTGLGLNITRSLIELHGGTIWVESEPGVGSRFHFTLPFSGKSPAPANDDEIKPILPSQGSTSVLADNLVPTNEDTDARPLILAVDDDPTNLRLLANQLVVKGYRVVTATDGLQALRYIDQAPEKFDLVILDLMMPQMSGYEVCRQLRQRFSLLDLPILILTAYSRLDDITAGFEAGANDYIVKPVDKQELLARVRTLLTLKKSVAEAQLSGQLATIDDLTGVYNRRHFFQVAEQTIQQAQMHRFPLSLIMFDLDYFKEINDTFGHTTGDDILQAIGERSQQLLRDNDFLARYGGDEFVVLLTRDSAAARQVAERLRNEIAAYPVVAKTGPISVTASFGLATMGNDAATIAGLLENADRALYQAKQQGRNRVAVFAP